MIKKIIPFTKYTIPAIIISLLILIIGVFVYVDKGINLGIDFTGGITINLQIFAESASIGEFRSFIKAKGFGETISQIGNIEDQKYIVKIPPGKNESDNSLILKNFQDTLKENYGEVNVQILSANIIGPSISQQLIQNSWLLALIVVSLISLYTLFRFRDYRYSIGAIAAIIHDGIISIAILIIAHKEFNTQSMAAILTLLGYSLNDSIVILSKIKENEFQFVVNPINKNILKQIKGKETFSHQIKDLATNINQALTITLSRTIVTGLSTIVVSLSIFLLGGIPTKDFAFILTIGLIIGTFSSIFISAPVLLLFKDPKIPKY